MTYFFQSLAEKIGLCMYSVQGASIKWLLQLKVPYSTDSDGKTVKSYEDQRLTSMYCTCTQSFHILYCN